MRRNIIRAIVRLLIRLLSHLTVEGAEHIPERGAFILATNHLSRLDAPILFGSLERADLTGLAADSYRSIPPIRWLVEAIDGIWLNRGEVDTHAIRAALEHLKAGGALGIAPEGTRSRSRALIKAKTGVAYLADKAGAPIVPVAVSGTENAWGQIKRLRRPRIHLKVGAAFRLKPVSRATRESDLQENTDEIMYRIAALLPEEYRGAYARHERVVERGSHTGARAQGDSELKKDLQLIRTSREEAR